ncbi:MAG: ribosome-associated translation inhibitor RaiA [Aggregatilineales bacterium]
MDLMIRGDNIRVTDALKEYTEKKLGKLDRYMPNIQEVRVDLARLSNRGGGVTSVQITLRHMRGAIIRAEEKYNGDESESTQAAINLAVDKLYRQIERFKGKRRKSRKGRDKFLATFEELETVEDIPEEEYETYDDVPEYEDIEYEIVRRKEVPVAPMTENDAIDQMELLGHAFFMFYNLDTNSMNVLYRRDDGDYGVLIPNMA